MINSKLLSQANLLIKNHEFESAEKIYLELLAKNPNDDIVQAFLGRLYIRQRKYKGAERILTTADNKRKTAPAIASLAYCKYQMKKYDEAVILYEELFRYDPDSIKIYDKIIQAFRELEMYKFAHAYSLKFYSKHPDCESANVRLTQSYIDIGEIKKAEEQCALTIQKFPKSGNAWIIAGTLQEFSYCNEELAQDCYLTAIDYGSKTAYYHLGVSYQKTGRYKEAEEAYKKMIELMPSEEYSQASLGSLYLTQKDIHNGYKYFLKREKTPDMKTLKNQWDGKDYPQETLLYFCDQGLGDNIQFIRYLPFVINKFEKIKVKTQKACMEIFKKNYPKTKYQNVEFYDNLEEAGGYDKYALSADMPYYLDIDFDHIPYSSGYLKADKNKTDYFKSKYFNTDKLKAGLCWRAGGVGMRAEINRTINIDYFKKILELEKIQFYSFQLDDVFNGVEKYPQMIDIKDDLHSFDDTAGAMANLDLLISVDTSCIHLAGAMGVKSYLLLPYCSDWRWFKNDKATEWYDSVEIFKQQDRLHWFKEIDKIYDKLKDYTK